MTFSAQYGTPHNGGGRPSEKWPRIIAAYGPPLLPIISKQIALDGRGGMLVLVSIEMISTIAIADICCFRQQWGQQH